MFYFNYSTVKPYIIGDGLQNMIIKKGQVITFDIKYGGEPEPEVKWIKQEEVRNTIIIAIVYRNAENEKHIEKL